jgi:hypothetical protein
MLQALRKLTGTPEHKLEPVTHHHLLQHQKFDPMISLI